MLSFSSPFPPSGAFCVPPDAVFQPAVSADLLEQKKRQAGMTRR